MRLPSHFTSWEGGEQQAAEEVWRRSLMELVHALENTDGQLNLRKLVCLVQSVDVPWGTLNIEAAAWPRDRREILVRRCREFELRCRHWPSGDWSSIHDHRGSACCVRVVAGIMTTTDFRRTSTRKLEALGTLNVPTGGIVARQDRDIHQVGNAQPPGQDLVTCHIYAPPLQRR